MLERHGTLVRNGIYLHRAIGAHCEKQWKWNRTRQRGGQFADIHVLYGSVRFDSADIQHFRTEHRMDDFGQRDGDGERSGGGLIRPPLLGGYGSHAAVRAGDIKLKYVHERFVRVSDHHGIFLVCLLQGA